MDKRDSRLRLATKHTGGAEPLQDSSSAVSEIKLSEEITTLRERNRELEAENALLREREAVLTRDVIETFNVVIETLRQLQPGKETNRFFVEAKKKIEATSPEDRPLIVNSRIKAAASMLRNSPPLVSVSMGGGQYHYNTRTRNENRAWALVDYLKNTGKSILKMPEARSILETHEHKTLDRKIVWRAMKAAQGLLLAKKDVVWGVGRLILEDPLVPPSYQIRGAVIDEGEESRIIEDGKNVRDAVPRRRRWPVPWDGAY